jgi:hypothetical protein
MRRAYARPLQEKTRFSKSFPLCHTHKKWAPNTQGAHLLYWYKRTCLLVQPYLLYWYKHTHKKWAPNTQGAHLLYWYKRACFTGTNVLAYWYKHTHKKWAPNTQGAHLLYWYKRTCLLVQTLTPEERQQSAADTLRINARCLLVQTSLLAGTNTDT